jgi:hypothetical protein
MWPQRSPVTPPAGLCPAFEGDPESRGGQPGTFTLPGRDGEDPGAPRVVISLDTPTAHPAQHRTGRSSSWPSRTLNPWGDPLLTGPNRRSSGCCGCFPPACPPDPGPGPGRGCCGADEEGAVAKSTKGSPAAGWWLVVRRRGASGLDVWACVCAGEATTAANFMAGLWHWCCWCWWS